MVECQLVPEVDVHMVPAAGCRLDLEVECPRAQAVVVVLGQEPGEIAGIAPIQIARQQLIETVSLSSHKFFSIQGLKRKIRTLATTSRAGFTQQLAWARYQVHG